MERRQRSRYTDKQVDRQIDKEKRYKRKKKKGKKDKQRKWEKTEKKQEKHNKKNELLNQKINKWKIKAEMEERKDLIKLMTRSEKGGRYKRKEWRGRIKENKRK